jgi:hypothetical protein
LSSELDELGIVDQRMSFYMPLRLREHGRDGYSGFEARYYSLFPSYDRDMAPAVSLQQFLLAVAYKLALQGELTHEQIPDDPTSESERRQPFFFSAAGLPAFYVHKDSRNQMLRTILLNCKKTRPSRRHPGYVRISIRDYRRAALAFLQQTGAELAESMNMKATLADLAARCDDEQQEASHRLIASVMGSPAASAMNVEAREFNRMAEDFYRDGLRREHLREAFSHLRQDYAALEKSAGDELRQRIRHGVCVQEPARFLQDVEPRLPADDLSLQEIAALLNLLLLLTEQDARRTAQELA